MSPQDCNNCYYPAPKPKGDDAKKVPQGTYRPADAGQGEGKAEEECPQCFYQEGAEEALDQETDECPQCFYKPESEEQKKEEEEEDCSQCFYRPTNTTDER